MSQLIQDAANLIADYNPALAVAFRNQPAQRINLAMAFAAGFSGEDVHPVASLVIRAAYLDRETAQ